MQKRSHQLLASCLLRRGAGFGLKRYELAFLFGSFQPDCNPLSYIKGSLSGPLLRGHNFPNSQPYILSRIARLQQRRRWRLWQYYTLGKLTHYLADTFTFPHNPHYPTGLKNHHSYETVLRLTLQEYLRTTPLPAVGAPVPDLPSALAELHRRYLGEAASPDRDVQYIVRATVLLMACCRPAAV